MAQIAHQEGLPDIANWFETMAKSKQVHEVKLRKALEQLLQASQDEEVLASRSPQEGRG